MLTAAQVGELRGHLQELQHALQGALGAAAERARAVDIDEPIGRVSRMDAIGQQTLAQASRRSLEQRLRLIAGALARVRAGEYGVCAGCEEPIGYRRLLARPETRYCLACQSARER